MNHFINEILQSKKSEDKIYARTLTLVFLTAAVSLALIQLGDLIWNYLRPLMLSLRDGIDANPDTNLTVTEAIKIVFNMLLMIVAIMLPTVFLCALRGRTPKAVTALPKKSIGYGFFFYLVFAVGAGYLATAFAKFAFSWTDVFNTADKFLPETNVGIILYYIYVAIFPAVFEEFLFRGVILGALLPYGKTQAIVISSVIFGLMHVNPIQAIFATVIGLVLGKLYVDSGSIWWGSLIHFIINSLATTVSYYVTGNNIALLAIIGFVSIMLMIYALAYGIRLIVLSAKQSHKPDFEHTGCVPYRKMSEALKAITTRASWAVVMFIAIYVYAMIYRFFI